MITATMTFIGNKPLLFDRYSNGNALELIDKVHWGKGDIAVIPTMHLHHGLTSWHTKSVPMMFYKEKARSIGEAIRNGLVICESEIPILKNGKPVLRKDFEQEFETVCHRVPYLRHGGPMPGKERPMLNPWSLEFNIWFNPSSELTWETMQEVFGYLGIIGLGTYRPLYGGFDVTVTETLAEELAA